MRVYVVPNQIPRLGGFGAFNGESEESHCTRVYADCPALMAKCLSKPYSFLTPKPYTVAGKLARGLPQSYSPGQCPGAAPASAPPPQQQPYNPPPVQQQYNPPPQQQPGGVLGPITAGGPGSVPFVPPAPTGYFDQLMANKPLLIGGAAVVGYFAWRATQRPSGRRSMNGYKKSKSPRS